MVKLQRVKKNTCRGDMGWLSHGLVVTSTVFSINKWEQQCNHCCHLYTVCHMSCAPPVIHGNASSEFVQVFLLFALVSNVLTCHNICNSKQMPIDKDVTLVLNRDIHSCFKRAYNWSLDNRMFYLFTSITVENCWGWLLSHVTTNPNNRIT